MTDINNKPVLAEITDIVQENLDHNKRTRLKGYDRILAVAKSLPLKDRVELVKELTRVNTEEVDQLRIKADEAAGLMKQ